MKIKKLVFVLCALFSIVCFSEGRRERPNEAELLEVKLTVTQSILEKEKFLGEDWSSTYLENEKILELVTEKLSEIEVPRPPAGEHLGERPSGPPPKRAPLNQAKLREEMGPVIEESFDEAFMKEFRELLVSEKLVSFEGAVEQDDTQLCVAHERGSSPFTREELEVRVKNLDEQIQRTIREIFKDPELKAEFIAELKRELAEDRGERSEKGRRRGSPQRERPAPDDEERVERYTQARRQRNSGQRRPQRHQNGGTQLSFGSQYQATGFAGGSMGMQGQSFGQAQGSSMLQMPYFQETGGFDQSLFYLGADFSANFSGQSQSQGQQMGRSPGGRRMKQMGPPPRGQGWGQMGPPPGSQGMGQMGPIMSGQMLQGSTWY